MMINDSIHITKMVIAAYQSSLLLQVVTVVAFAAFLFHGGNLYSKYTEQRFQDETEDRQAKIRLLRKADSNWKDVASEVNNARFRDKYGKRFSAKEIKEEYMGMLEQVGDKE